jgi:hypothetical protein
MTAYRVLGIANGAINTETHDINFDLTVEGRPLMQFIMTYGAATQVIGALGKMFSHLQSVVQSQKQGQSAVAAEAVAGAHIQKDRWQDIVIFQLTTPQGIPYNFAMPTKVASDIADRLKTESAKSTDVGHA